MIPEQYQWILNFNPMYYIIEGYRNSFIYYEWFWNLGYMNYYFWFVTISIIFIGIFIFKKLRPHFADVL